jgi:hypothetical protein
VDGKQYAVVNSLTNSTYALIWNPVTFADVEGHWAQSAVSDMAERMVVRGKDEKSFSPNTFITRGEFATIAVRALGLSEKGGTAEFKDVDADHPYAGAIAKAKEYGIINGYEDGTFRSTDAIARQEAMVMVSRMMKIVGLESEVASDETLSRFADREEIAPWAKQAIAAAVEGGLVNGSSAGLLPKSHVTRAETAAMIQRMLVKAKLIQDMKR